MTRPAAILWLALLLTLGLEAQPLRFSHPSGCYAEGFTLSLEAPSGYLVRYTLDGSQPTAASPLFADSLVIDRAALPSARLFSLRTTRDSAWYAPDSVGRIAVVRAALFDSSGVRRSQVESRSYVVGSLLGRELSLPVLSLCTDSASLFDADTGIMVLGNHFDPLNPSISGNFTLRGREWERRAHLCFIDDGTAYLEQDCGVRMHGGMTRSTVQKSFSLYARADYGDKKFRYPLFGDFGPSSCKRLVLRPWSASWSSAGLEDWLCQQLAAPLRCDRLASRPAVLFLNGEYWGVVFIEEKPDEHYVEDHHSVDDSEVSLLVNWGDVVEKGSAEAWNKFYEWLEEADPSSDLDYGRLQTEVDLDALIDYMLLQVFVCNVDWPANNVRHWIAPGHPWRWIFFDGDAAFADWRLNSEMLHLLTCDHPDHRYPSSPHATLLFRRLLQRDEFALQSVDRFSQLINDHWNYTATSALLQEIVEQLQDELPFQSERFGTPKSLSSWCAEVQSIDHYLETRAANMVSDYATHIGVWNDIANLTLFPNPTTGFAQLSVEVANRQTLSALIFDSYGRQVAQADYQLGPGRNIVDLPSGLSSGTYFIRLLPMGITLRLLVL